MSLSRKIGYANGIGTLAEEDVREAVKELLIDFSNPQIFSPFLIKLISETIRVTFGEKLI